MVVPAYLEGLTVEGVGGVEGLDGVEEQVRWAFATTVLLRSGFDGLLLERLGDTAPGAREAFDERVAMSRHLLALHAALT